MGMNFGPYSQFPFFKDLCIFLKENTGIVSTSRLHRLVLKSKSQNMNFKLSKADNGTGTLCKSQAVLLSKMTLAVKEIVQILEKKKLLKR